MDDTQSSLQKELHQERPFRSLGQEAVVALLYTADLLRRHLSRVVEPNGITLQQYNVLRILRNAGKEGLPTLEIGERMMEQTPGVTRLLDRLEVKGLISRSRGSNDRRQVLCRLTPAGRDILAELDPAMDQADETGVAVLRQMDKEKLLGLLEEIRKSHAGAG
jgi:DNA-binding MarR family transcriptional regulator